MRTKAANIAQNSLRFVGIVALKSLNSVPVGAGTSSISS